jgi:hypothetical protein
LLELTVNGKIPVASFRDEKVTELSLRNKYYKAADGITIASLLEVVTFRRHLALMTLKFFLFL